MTGTTRGQFSIISVTARLPRQSATQRGRRTGSGGSGRIDMAAKRLRAAPTRLRPCVILAADTGKANPRGSGDSLHLAGWDSHRRCDGAEAARIPGYPTPFVRPFPGTYPSLAARPAEAMSAVIAMAEHEFSIGLSSDWLTPKPIFDGLGHTFDLDPAHPGRDNPYVVVPTRRIYTASDAEWRI
jgi:hypothetical protein